MAADGSDRPPSCEIVLFADAAKQEFVKFKVQELQYAVHDDYTGRDHQVFGLGGFAVRGGQNPVVADDQSAARTQRASSGAGGSASPT